MRPDRPAESERYETGARIAARAPCPLSSWRLWLTSLYRHIVALVVAGVDLARAGDLLLRVVQQLAPLRQPADGARDCEHHREDRRRQTDSLVDQAGVEIDV